MVIHYEICGSNEISNGPHKVLDKVDLSFDPRSKLSATDSLTGRLGSQILGKYRQSSSVYKSNNLESS